MQFMRAVLAGKDPGQFPPPPDLPAKSTASTLDTPDLAPAADETH
jgi:hypothetical protein